MPEVRDQLIEAAVRPLEDSAEMKAAAVHLLERVASPDALGAEQVIRRFDEVDRKKRGLWWILPWVLLAVISVGVIAADHREVRRYVAWRSWFGGNMGTMPPAQDGASTELTHRQKLLLGRAEDPLSRSLALWREEPENPAFFAEYACLFMQDNNKALPPDFLRTARRIDPDNAMFTYLAASVEGHDSVEQEQDSSWKILDQQRFDRATALIREATLQSRYQSYAGEMLHLRLTEFPVRSRIHQMDLITGIAHHPSPNIKHYQALTVIIARCWLALKTGTGKPISSAVKTPGICSREWAATPSAPCSAVWSCAAWSSSRQENLRMERPSSACEKKPQDGKDSMTASSPTRRPASPGS